MGCELLFGTAGIPESVEKPRTSLAGIRRVHESGLGCMEIEFVQGVSMSETLAAEVNRVAVEMSVELSVHAPYAINLNSQDPVKVEASKKRILSSARTGAICGARSVVFHAAFYGSDSVEKVHESVKMSLEDILSEMRRDGTIICLRPEVMGRGSQYGTLGETLQLCSEMEGVLPTIDFAHIHARTGRYNSYDEFTLVLKEVERVLGAEALHNFHGHVSGIKYGSHGEKEHVNLQDSDFDYVSLLRALKDCAVCGLVVCESPHMEADAQLLKRTFNGL